MFKIILPTLNCKIERWKWNKEYRIYISTLGHAKNEYKQNLPIRISKGGYCNVKTACGYKSVHRLVLLTFKPIPNAEDLTVDHLNHNKRDNSINNLEWVSKKENLERASRDFIKKIKIISNIDDEVEKIIKNNPIIHKIRIKNKIIKSIETNTPYRGVYYKIKGEE